MQRPYFILTGYHERSHHDRHVAECWLLNTRKLTAAPIVVVETDKPFPAMPITDTDVYCVSGRNCGHVGDLLNGSLPHSHCGWSVSILVGAMLAHHRGEDMIMKEQDCFWKGDCIERLYAPGLALAFGANTLMGVAQSLFLLRHEHALDFVRDYLALGDDRDVSRLPEHKFARLAQQNPKLYGLHDLYGDRDRPIPWDSEGPFYAQQLTDTELFEFQGRGWA